MPSSSSKTNKTRRIAVAAIFACAFVALLVVSIWQLALHADSGQENGTTAQQTNASENSSSTSAKNISDKQAPSTTSDGGDSDADAGTADDDDPQSSTSKSTSNANSDTEKASSQDSLTSGASNSGTTNPGSTGSGSSSNGSSTPPTSQEPPPPATITVSISIDCVNAVNYGSATAQSLSSSGYLLSTQLTLSPGATVYDALIACGAPVNASSSAMGTYVTALYSLQEKVCGPTSGWLYLVNGSQPSASCSSYSLSDGDTIQWRYSVNPGDI